MTIELHTPDEMLQYGDHLSQVRTHLVLAGSLLLQEAGCVADHCGGAAAGRAVITFLHDTLKPACQAIDAQLADLGAKLDTAESEVKALEELLSAPQRPGEGGYL